MFRRLSLRILLLVCAGTSFYIIGCSGSGVLWKYKTGGFLYAEPVIHNDSLIIGSADSYVYSLLTETGALKWKTKLKAKIASGARIKDGFAYLGDTHGYFYKLNADTGKVIWSIKVPGRLEYEPCFDESAIYFGTYGEQFYKISPEGKILWTFEPKGKCGGECTIYKNLVIFPTWKGSFFGVDRSTAQVVWEHRSNIHNYERAELSGENLYYGTHLRLYRLDAATGKELNQEKTSYVCYVFPWQNFIWSSEKGLTKRKQDLQEIQTVSFPSNPSVRPVIYGDKGVILTGHTNDLYGVTKDLKIVWKKKLGEQFPAPGAIKDDVYYAGNRDSNVYAIRLF